MHVFATSFRALDIGQSLIDDPHHYPGDVKSCMVLLLNGLPKLTHLDISGTNLAGRLEALRYVVFLCYAYHAITHLGLLSVFVMPVK
jgi:hypothetical protein